MANGDPLLTGTDVSYPNVNSSSAPTSWEEDLVRAAGEGIPAGPGPMLTLTKRSTEEPFLPGGALNPAAEAYPSCVEVRNVQVRQGTDFPLTEARIGLPNVAGAFTAGVPGSAGTPSTGNVGTGVYGESHRGSVSSATRAARPRGTASSASPNPSGAATPASTAGRTGARPVWWARASSAVAWACEGPATRSACAASA